MNKKKLKDYFSTQQSLDCDTENKGCDGGEYNKSFDYFKNNSEICFMN